MVVNASISILNQDINGKKKIRLSSNPHMKNYVWPDEQFCLIRRKISSGVFDGQKPRDVEEWVRQLSFKSFGQSVSLWILYALCTSKHLISKRLSLPDQKISSGVFKRQVAEYNRRETSQRPWHITTFITQRTQEIDSRCWIHSQKGILYFRI